MSDETIAVNGDRHDVTLVPDPSHDCLNQRQRTDYKEFRRELAQWLLGFGKDPDHAEGYAGSTVRRRMHDIDVFYRWVWDERDGYTLSIDTDALDDYCRSLVYSDHSDAHKSNAQKSLKTLARYHDDIDDWDPSVTFSGDSARQQPRDFFTREERRLLEEASLEYGGVSQYHELAHDEKKELSHRFRKPIDAIDSDDVQRANGFKVPSLVWTSLDAGLRPVEVGRARVSWIDLSNARLLIPAEEASKSRDNWKVALRERTATMLERWLEERELYDKYDETDALWLTREAHPYSSRSLKYLLGKLCETAGIDTSNRQISWYAIRHSTGTYMTRQEGLVAASEQLRNSPKTMQRYDQAPTEDRRDALNRMG
ncbi:Tyrosine recombinase XerC protein [Halorhabdus tiamatea SARL4B]|uniref:Tyrosine recombinase XerC protein n=1 Tax=Halorhabdus tiamatea SARL4B TaxID=1033806 RepID=U2E576_9EURY|nr:MULTISPECIES: site-specific integrase [Halorhabdus]ERJ07076.1 Tyrosine recombinase XerC protein [Halorhabdus tiamatea SARL4B]QGN06714.1 site-specific integrase [Halorhabdus sp. CBA1104]